MRDVFSYYRRFEPESPAPSSHLPDAFVSDACHLAGRPFLALTTGPMALQEIHLPVSKAEALPDDVRAFLAGAHIRTEAFYAEQLGLRYPKYIPSDPGIFHTALTFLQEEDLLQGDAFCEWGSGFAIASGIAALSGFDAYAIEVEEELANRAAELMAEFDLPVEILNLSYLPDGFEESEGHGGKDLIVPDYDHAGSGCVGGPQYDGLDPGGIDLFYVYPWPDQEEMMRDLFEAVAAPGAILLMYLGDGEIAAFRHEDDDY